MSNSRFTTCKKYTSETVLQLDSMLRISPHILTQKGFTLIELIVGMLIFSIAMTAILALLHSTIENALYSRHEIIASNILREQIELVKNIRNSNVRNFIPFDTTHVDGVASSSFHSWTYIIEDDFTTKNTTINTSNGNIDASPVFLKDITLNYSPDPAIEFSRTQLNLDNNGRYTHRTGTGTNYASYIIITPLWFDNNGNYIKVEKNSKPQWYLLDARVIVKAREYKEYDLRTIITDWKK